VSVPLDPSLSHRCLGTVRLVVLGQVSLLPESFPAEGASKGFLPGMGPDVDRDGVLVLESLVANVAVVERALLPRGGPR